MYQAKLFYNEDPNQLEKELNEWLMKAGAFQTIKEVKTDVGSANNRVIYFASVLYQRHN